MHLVPSYYLFVNQLNIYQTGFIHIFLWQPPRFFWFHILVMNQLPSWVTGLNYQVTFLDDKLYNRLDKWKSKTPCRSYPNEKVLRDFLVGTSFCNQTLTEIELAKELGNNDVLFGGCLTFIHPTSKALYKSPLFQLYKYSQYFIFYCWHQFTPDQLFNML